ncbi:MAG TPA: pirin family protein [Rhodospirillales bacterium]|nr:pirin family protein [Rhodospirillales bacterium]
MSWVPCDEPAATGSGANAIETVLEGKAKDLGDFEVRRLLPSSRRRMVGSFIFFDQMGPADFPAGRGIDVRPHPHIGLATVTYLFAGEILHRDSLGTVQPIRPGDVNWMTAGRGIVHSERTGPETRAAGGPLAGIQAWVALPHPSEEAAPAFAHHPAADLPVIEADGCQLRLIAGTWEGVHSPVATDWETIYADLVLTEGARLSFPAAHEERAVYPVEGAIEIDGHTPPADALLVLRPDRAVTITARTPARVMLLGGAAMDGPRHIWWNFVSSSPERIEQAKQDWREQRFAPVPGESEFIPLPQG